ncbi:MULTISPECIES: NAD(P)/FAD-dependent oxidoreductase [Roseobacteraceae]|nr:MULTISPECIES: NAD(P)/FAD-dependent oxidoreductase [Roseobacteraceae]
MIYDCAIVGGGPAGMNAAILLAEAGVRVVIMDRAARAGGQVYRSAADSVLPRPEALGLDYTEGVALITAFESCAATHIAAADVWHIGEDGTILYSLNGTTRQLQAREILLCPGAIERPMPIPGWTLPGVMTAGAAQVMLKSDAVVAEKAIFAGSGPLLYLIVAQYLRLGVKVAGVIDTTPKANYLAALPGGAAALRSWPMLRKGLNLMREISNSGVPVFKAATNLSVLGQIAATGLAFECNGAQEIQAETVFLHHGVIPHSNMSRSLGLEHLWNEAQQCWQVKTDSWGQSSIPHIAVAGDGAGIIGADGAQCAGRLAACNILYRLNVFSLNERDQRARKDQSKLIGMAPFRAFIDRLYQPVEELRLPKDPETLVCRCEEQRLKDLRAGYEAGARDPNALKSLTRCGMGPCQGRQCGPIVSSLLARWRQEPEEVVGYYRLRSPQRLLSLAEFSRFRYDDETGTEAEVSG